MGALRQAWASTSKYLGELSGKDKTLIGSLVVVGILALVLIALWSSKATTVQLLPDMGPAEQAAAETALTEADIEHTSKGGKIYVTPDKRMYALAYLQQAGKLPENTQTLFSALSKGQNWMATSKDSDRLANAALCEVLGGVITNFKGVERATVMIDAPEQIGMGTSFRKPTASVGVLMKSGRTIDRDMVDAMAAMVSGAKAGLAMGDVRIIDQRRGEQYTPRTANSLGSGGGGDYLELISKHEDYIQKKVAAVVSRHDPLSIVTVSLQADNTVKKTTTKTFMKDGNGTVSVPESVSNDTNKDVSGSGASGAGPGLTSNVSADVSTGSSGATGSNSSKENETSKYKVGLGETNEDIFAPGGMPTRVSVMVSLSREYISALVKTKKGTVKAADGSADTKADEPTQAEIDAAFADEKKRFETDLTPLIANAATETKASSLQRVTVSLIPVPQLGMTGLGMGGAGGSQLAAVGGGVAGGLVGQLSSGPFVRTAFLGLLAFVAMGMMLMLVRKSAKPQNLPSPEELAGLPPVIDAGDDIVGEADEGSTAMEGIELGEKQIKTKKMLESIEDMVKKSPTDAASLMNRWMNVER